MRVCPTYAMKHSLPETTKMKLTKIAFVVASLAASGLATAAGQTSANFAMPDRKSVG